MPGPYTKGAQVVEKIGALIADGVSSVTAGTSSMASSAVTSSVTHGLAGTPDFILLSREAGATTWAANSTAVTFTRAASTAASVVSYIFGYTA